MLYKKHHIFFYKMADMTGDAIFSYLLLFSIFGYIFFSVFEISEFSVVGPHSAKKKYKLD